MRLWCLVLFFVATSCAEGVAGKPHAARSCLHSSPACVDGSVDSGARGIRDAQGVEGSIDVDARAESIDGRARTCQAEFIGGEVLTHHNDNARTGANLLERALDPCTVPRLVQLAAFPVEGEIFAQPLFARDVETALGWRNLLVVATTATVVDGKVFVASSTHKAGTSRRVLVFGLP